MNISRRFFLKSTGALALYCGISPGNILGSNAPAIVTQGKTLVVIFLRGGMDGLNFLVPFADPGYAAIRKSIGIKAPGTEGGALDIDGFFGLHPKAAALLPFFKDGTAMGLHAVGYALNTRSHFEEQDVWETGVIGNTVSSDGWLNRHLLTSTGHGPVRAVSIGDNLPRILRGKAPAFALEGISDLSFPSSKQSDDASISAALEHAYCVEPRQEKNAARDLLAETAQTTLDGMHQIQRATAGVYTPGAEYPKTTIGKRLAEAARLIKCGLGVEVVEIDYGGWDTHQNQGNVEGAFGNLVGGLSDAIAAFTKDLGSKMNDTLLLTISDFGRTAAENGTAGTDHGWANCMLAVGGDLSNRAGKSSPVLSQWPGLAKDQLHQGRDLLHTTDFRDVLGEVVTAHLGNARLKTVLPGHEFKPVGLV
ncbi:MAG: DUF1501 domain-containing protein [Chthoniobacterales bacterium]